jgi:glycerol-3-phosphate acyltransferase PlsY
MLPAVDLPGAEVVVWTLVCYLVGAIPFGVLIARSRGVDLRAVGSGNIGATNAVRALGSRWGLLVFALDVCKSACPLFLASRPTAIGALPDADTWLAGCALAAVLGHMFPVYLKFRGGKGVASALGVILVLDPAVAGAALATYVLGLLVMRSSAVGSLLAVTSMTAVILVLDRPWAQQLLVVVLAVLIWIRHRSNIAKLVRKARDRKTKSPQ